MISLRCGKSQANPFLYCLPGNFRYYAQIIFGFFNTFNSKVARFVKMLPVIYRFTPLTWSFGKKYMPKTLHFCVNCRF